MKSACRDADFRAEAKFAAIAELRGRIPKPNRGSNAIQELLRSRSIFGDDCFRMLTAKATDMGKGFTNVGDHFHRQDRIQPFSTDEDELLGMQLRNFLNFASMGLVECCILEYR